MNGWAVSWDGTVVICSVVISSFLFPFTVDETGVSK